MRWIAILLLLIMIAAAGIYGAGRALPMERQQSAEAVLAASPQAVWVAVSDLPAYAGSGEAAALLELRKVEGQTGVWQAELRDGTQLELTEIARTEPRLLAVEARNPDGSYQAVWAVELRPDPALAGLDAKPPEETPTAPVEPSATRVSVTEKRHIESPWRRFAVYYLAEGERALPQRYLDGLAERFPAEKKARP